MRLPEDECGTDGCAIPTWAIPLDALAQAFARFGTGQGLGERVRRRRGAFARPCAAQPYYVAGSWGVSAPKSCVTSGRACW